MIKYYNINGKLIPKDEANLKVNDLSILRGYGVFDYFFVKNGQPLFFNDYVNRFENSIKMLEMELPISKMELKEQIMALIEANGLSEAAIRLLLTGGYAADGFTPKKPNLLILEHLQKKHPSAIYENGIRLMTHLYLREMPEAKTTNYVTGISLMKRLKQEGAFDVLYHDGQWISESARSNFFIVTYDNVIVTPANGILKGITRKQVLDIAKNHYKIEERQLHLSELKTAKEVFLSSTTKGTMPVVQVDNIIIGSGKVGSVTTHLKKLYEERVEEYLAELV